MLVTVERAMSEQDYSKGHLPGVDDFLTWAKQSMGQLKKNPSNFLLDADKPSSVNRVNTILKSPHLMRYEEARRFEAELRREAMKQGQELLPMPRGCLNGSVVA